jgi:hypothetical protein
MEKSLEQKIESFFLSVYPANHLVSHGLEHHRRVWEYAKEIIADSGKSHLKTDSLFLTRIMIACYFHDIGMAEDHGVNHGISGIKKCEEFLRWNKMTISEFKDTLEAIGYHDDKEYNTTSSRNRILTILSIADDLDAFGFRGIYRYSDIYLRRGVKPAELGLFIRKNSAGRYANFVRNGELSASFLKKHSDRFKILDSFFVYFDDQVHGYKFRTHYPSGYCGVVDIIISVIESENNQNFPNILKKYSNDSVIEWFFKGYVEELDPHNAIMQ